MRRILLISIFACITVYVQAQTVGYQGKRFMISGGFSGMTNSLAIFGNQEYYDIGADGEGVVADEIPFQVRIAPQIRIEGVATNNVSVYLRFSPLNVNVNSFYEDTVAYVKDAVQISSRGSIVGIGVNFYPEATAAPLGFMYGFEGFRYSFKASYEQSDLASSPLPTAISNYALESSGAWGVGVHAGTRFIFWDKISFELLAETNAMFNNPEADEYPDIYADIYNLNPNHFNHPNTMVTANSKVFMLAFFSLNVGYLL